MSTLSAKVNIDGAARGNPGPAAFAYVIARDGEPALEDAQRMGMATNNVAEYTALVRALQRAVQIGLKKLHIHSDSELLVKQMNGVYRVKNADLQVLYEQAKGLCAKLEAVQLTHVRREQNSRADHLCNLALDGRPLPTPAADAAPAPVTSRREELLTCLRTAAQAWARGNAEEPTPEAVLEQLEAIWEKDA